VRRMAVRLTAKVLSGRKDLLQTIARNPAQKKRQPSSPTPPTSFQFPIFRESGRKCSDSPGINISCAFPKIYDRTQTVSDLP